MSVAIAYIRVSTKSQKLSAEIQRASIEAWARSQGATVAGWHVDQPVSGARPIAKRPGLLAALAELREHDAGVLVVSNRDRMARSVLIARQIESAVALAGARVVSAEEIDPLCQEFRETVLGALAKYELAMRAQGQESQGISLLLG
jgi:DNA invertase Pin-like site-specific DNA recombinase